MKITKVISLICVIALSVCMVTSCGIVKNTNPAVRVDETDMSADEFGYYVYVQTSQALQEAGITGEDDTQVQDYFNAKKDGKTNMDIILEKASQDAVNLLVQYNKAVAEGTEFTEEDKTELEAQISSMKLQTGGEGEYAKQLAAIGTTPEAFESLYKKNMVITKYIEKLIGEGVFNITDEEIENYIKENYIKAAHILFLTQNAETGELYEADVVYDQYTKAQRTLDRIKSGEDFNTLMHELSEDTGLQQYPDGYEFTKGQMVPQFEEAAFSLGIDEVSDIVETSYGYHIIKRLPFDLTPEKIEEYKSAAKTACEMAKTDALTKEWEEASKVKVFKSVIKQFK